jgi:hypothetical protein
MGADPEAVWKCCACSQLCQVRALDGWLEHYESTCCGVPPYRVDLTTCDGCGDPFDPEEGGSVDEVAECNGCAEDRAAYEIRHAHPPAPTDYPEYLIAQGRRA